MTGLKAHSSYHMPDKYLGAELSCETRCLWGVKNGCSLVLVPVGANWSRRVRFRAWVQPARAALRILSIFGSSTFMHLKSIAPRKVTSSVSSESANFIGRTIRKLLDRRHLLERCFECCLTLRNLGPF